MVYNRTQSPDVDDPYENEDYVEDTETETKETPSASQTPSSPSPQTPSGIEKKIQQEAPPRKSLESIKENVAKTVEKKRAEDMVKAIKNFTPEELEEVQGYYRRLESEWKNIVKDMLGENYSEYQEIRREFQIERQESFRKFHISMIDQHGRDHVYSPTEYENKVGKAIQERYFKRIEERFGTETYNRYIENLQQFNREAKRHQDPSKGLLQIFL